MSLTSYRAAPPRDKPLRALPKNRMPKRHWPTRKRADPVRRLPEKATPGKCPWGRGGYVPTRARFGKGQKATFEHFITVKTRYIAPKQPAGPLLPELAPKPSLKANTDPEETPWTSP